ncbi:DUF4214 domain-containing protein [Massilia endophytica]|uniref:DUF4214 domain-containing protein n=1 Tax=Massilia endophytica TaxID=2899220 RepID=UPI001E41BB34|nr:DUF4214 domain-containing protein [Massilia endophytica]UGQ47677.1 DUF4214 domain-containing protein [Massilia endophytica]
MHHPRLALLAAAAATLLSACGGGTPETQAPPSAAMPAQRSAAALAQQGLTAKDYEPLIQSMYLAYFGRPAEFLGLPYWTQKFAERGLPSTVDGMLAAYEGNAEVRAMMDQFANSEESQSLYVGNNRAFINAVYLNIFNRNAESAGLAHWAAKIDQGQMSRGRAVLTILQGAQGGDLAMAALKLRFAAQFTASLDVTAEILAYTGDNMNEAARTLLSTLTANADPAAFQAMIDDFLARMTQVPGPFPLVSRYLGYQYQADPRAGPAYSARYIIEQYGVLLAPERRGTLVFGEAPEQVSWTRSAGNAPVYGAPMTSSVGIPASYFLPTLTMLCRPPAGKPGAAAVATDIVVSRLASQAAQADLMKAGLSVYREHCKAAQPRTALADVLKQDRLQGYSYQVADGSRRYLLVVQAAPGVLGLWSQE